MKQITFLFLVLLVISCSKPIAQFSTSAETLTAPVDVAFTNTSEKAERYEWDFGDGTSATDKNPIHHYVKSGTYQVVLKAFKGNQSKISKQKIIINPPTDCLVEIQTPFGNMVVQLDDRTPLHRDNFSKLAEEGFYNDLLFHRVMSGFMIQGGDPTSRGSKSGRLGLGGPGYTIPAEISPNIIHLKGAIAAARKPNNPKKLSSGSQFYIVQGKPVTDAFLDRIEANQGFTYTPSQRKAYLEKGGTPQLDREYTVFGKVIKGHKVIDKIAGVKTNKAKRPDENVWMKIFLIN